MRTLFFGLVAGIAALAAAAAPAARAGESDDAGAAIEITTASARRGPSATLDDPWIEGLLLRATWPEYVAEAAKAARLPESDAFKGMSAEQIAGRWSTSASVSMERQPGTDIVLVRGRAGDEARRVAIANAVTQWIALAARAEAASRWGTLRTKADERVQIADAQIRLLTIDKSSALQSLNVAEATFALALERATEFVRARGADADRLRAEIADDTDAEAAFTVSSGDREPTIESMSKHWLVARDAAFRAADDDVRTFETALATLKNAGMGAAHEDIVRVTEKLALATLSRKRAVRAVTSELLTRQQVRRARLARAEADVSAGSRRLVELAAVQRTVAEKDAEIARRREEKRAALAELERFADDADAPAAIRVLTVAGFPSQAWK